MDWLGLLGIFGFASIAVILWILGQLSKKLGEVTHAKPYYFGLYFASLCVWVSVFARMANLFIKIIGSEQLEQSILWILFYNGLPAVAVTISIVIAWYYWSWLLAERD